MYSFGLNSKGKLGLGDTADRLVPTSINYLSDKNVTYIAAGDTHSLVLTLNETVYSFGGNGNGDAGVTMDDLKEMEEQMMGLGGDDYE